MQLLRLGTALQLAGYKVKCMLAEPKSKGHRDVLPPADMHAAALYRVSVLHVWC